MPPELENENDVQGQQPDVTQDAGNANAGTSGGTDESSSQQQDNSNDIYAQYLEKFPESLHPIAREVFREWDGNVTQRIQSVHGEYEPYKPFIEGYEPQALDMAVRMAEALENDPAAFIEAVSNAYGITPTQAMQVVDDAQQQEVLPDLDPNDPYALRLQQHEELLRTMAQSLLDERDQREQLTQIQQQEADYEATMTELSTKYGEFDVDYVNVLLAQGVDPDAAVQHWQSQVESFAQQRLAPNTNAPVVMGAGGGTPSIRKDVENLSSQDTRRLVEDMLRQAAESGK